MDRVTDGLGVESPQTLPPGFDASVRGPLDRPTAIAVLSRADDLLESDDAQNALIMYSRAIGMVDRDVSAAGLYGAGNALYRMDRDEDALRAWEQATSLGETPVTYKAWRQVAAARVRSGDLRGALDAYRQCEKRAPREHRAEIASRLGWLSKETGDTRAAGRYFARSRGDSLPPFLTYAIIAITAIVSLAAMAGGHTDQFGRYVYGSLELQLMLDKIAVAHGELYRLFSVTLVHDPQDILHLAFNIRDARFSALSERSIDAVGASGAIFGLFGIVLIATRYHHAVLDRQSRAIASQVGVLIVINLFLGFSGFFNVDNAAHVGGLLAGIWLALLVPPTQVQTLASAWQGSRTARTRAQILGLRVVAVAVLAVVIVAGLVVGTSQWKANPFYQQYGAGIAPGVSVVHVAAASEVQLALS